MRVDLVLGGFAELGHLVVGSDGGGALKHSYGAGDAECDTKGGEEGSLREWTR